MSEAQRMSRRSSGAQHEFSFQPSDGGVENGPPPHDDADYIPPQDDGAPRELTADDQRMLAELTGGAGAEPRGGGTSRRARSAAERQADKLAEHAWRQAMVDAGTRGDWDEATRIAEAGPTAFRGSSPAAPFLPGTTS